MSRTATVCDVCRLVDGDLSTKLCTWCGTCKAWICDADWWNLGRRGLAMALRRMGRGA